MTNLKRMIDDGWITFHRVLKIPGSPERRLSGADYNELCDLVESLEGQVEAGGIPSDPPSGKCKILNIYWDPDIQKAVFEYEDEAIP